MNSLDQQLLRVCQNSNTPAVEELLQQGANPNAKDNYGKTPIIIAAEYGYTDIITTLIQYGADPNATEHKGQTALHCALNWHRCETAQYLLTQLKLDPNIQSKSGYTPFLIATYNGDLEILQLLIQHGANPHTTDYKGQSALHYALENQNHNATQYLLTQLKLNPNTQDKNGTTPLMIATKNGDIKMLQLLIQHGADPHTTDYKGQTTLHHAIEKQYRDIAQYLLTRLHLDPNTQDRRGQTPFMIASSKGDTKILRLLTQLGANPYATDHQGRSALHYAVENYHYEVLKYLITYLQLDPNTQDHEGITPLLIAIERGYTFIAQTLIQLGAHPHIPNHQGEIPADIFHRRGIQLPQPQPSTITL